MIFTVIEVVALFFISINIFIVLVFLTLLLDKFLKYKARIKIETECKVNNDLVKVITSFCEYAQRKGDKQARITNLHRLLPHAVAQELKKQYGYCVFVNGLGEICIRGWTDETDTNQAA